MIEIVYLLFTIVMFVLLLSFLVLIHELGHFLAARWAKIRVEEFGLGYPPKAITLFKQAETAFTLNWIPFGGFVRMDGEDGPAPVEEKIKGKADEKKIDQQHQNAFYTKTTFQKLVVILAGVTVNFIFGILAFSVFYTFAGIPTYIDRARVEMTVPNSPAQQAGIPNGVEIIAIRDQAEQVIAVSSNKQVADAIEALRGQTVTIVTTGTCSGLSCQELAQEFEVYVRTQEEVPAGEGAIGVGFTSYVINFYPWYEMPIRGTGVGFQQTYLIVVETLQALQKMVMNFSKERSLPVEAVGPVGIVHQAVEYRLFDQGPLMILNFAGIISVSLAIMNLLPIMPLDGGRAVFIIAEHLFGRKRTEKIEGYAQYIGIILLMLFIVGITGRDIWRIFV